MPQATGSSTKTSNTLPCTRCRQAFKASPRQRERAATGAAVYCSRDCQKGANLVALTCAHCGADVTRRKADVPASQRVFCDGECRNRAVKPKTGQMVPCAVCDTEFYVIPALAEYRKTCSRPCQAAWNARNAVTRPCDHCGAEYTRSPSTVGRFCKKQCELDHRTKNGGVYVNPSGYAVRSIGGWPYLVHRLAFQSLLDRPLLSHEEPHHLNGNRTDNRLDGPAVMGPNGKLVSGNLELWSTSQPAGQEIGQKVSWALELLGEYAPFLTDDHRATLRTILAGQYVLPQAPEAVSEAPAAEVDPDAVADTNDNHTLTGALAELRRLGADMPWRLPVPGKVEQ